MIKVALVFDNVGHSNILKGFFESCASDFKIFLAQHERDLVEIEGASLSHITINERLSAIVNKFLFVSFSHGNVDSLICGHTPSEYISLTINPHLFNGSFFYTWSCHSSVTLGERLRSDHGCAVYWGYKNLIWAPVDPEQQGIFIQCANRGVQQFIAGQSVQDAKYNAVEFHNEMIDELADINYPLSAWLRRNRDAMDVQGNMNLTIDDFRY